MQNRLVIERINLSKAIATLFVAMLNSLEQNYAPCSKAILLGAQSYTHWSKAILLGAKLYSLEQNYTPWSKATLLAFLEQSYTPWSKAILLGAKLYSLEQNYTLWSKAIRLASLEQSYTPSTFHNYELFHTALLNSTRNMQLSVTVFSLFTHFSNRSFLRRRLFCL